MGRVWQHTYVCRLVVARRLERQQKKRQA